MSSGGGCGGWVGLGGVARLWMDGWGVLSFISGCGVWMRVGGAGR